MKKTLQNYFFEKTDKAFIQLIRYTFVGALAFLVDFGLLWILTDICKIYYLISATLSFIVGLIVNFLISTRWVFNKSKINNKKVEFLFFGVIGIIGLGLNDLFIWLLTKYCGLYYLISKLIVVFFVYLWNFFARKYLLYKN